ncbi:MAG: Virginiamycin B lyase [Candidatus Eremiobacteraeota bacterium]|nr:Virginiamycin B lyase [Candidatus Eremiobacteraeota bacterium]
MRVESETVRIREFDDLPRYGSGGSGNYYVGMLAAGPGGLIWVIDDIDQDFGPAIVTGISTSGKAQHHYSAASNYFGYQDITAGPDGALWLTDSYNNRISRLTTNGRFTNYNVPSHTPLNITTGPDRALWFTASGASGGAIGRINTRGKMTFYAVGGQVGDITAGPDDALWFTEQQPTDAIGRIALDGIIRSYTTGIHSLPNCIALGPDGALWFGENGGNIGRITTSGKVKEYSHASRINDIAAGPDGAMWFTEGSQIGRISMSGVITEYANGLLSNADPWGIVEGPDERMWFTDYNNNETGRVTP